MKLYTITKEQYIKLQEACFSRWGEDLYENLTPIEIPSDEEIEKEVERCFKPTLNKFGEPKTQIVAQNPYGFNKFKKTFTNGYKAALTKILNQNK